MKYYKRESLSEGAPQQLLQKKIRKVFRKAIFREAFLSKFVTTVLLRTDTLHGNYFPRNFLKLLRISISLEARDSTIKEEKSARI